MLLFISPIYLIVAKPIVIYRAHFQTPCNYLAIFQPQITNNTFPDAVIEPSTPCPAVILFFFLFILHHTLRYEAESYRYLHRRSRRASFFFISLRFIQRSQRDLPYQQYRLLLY